MNLIKTQTQRRVPGSSMPCRRQLRICGKGYKDMEATGAHRYLAEKDTVNFMLENLKPPPPP